MFATLVGAYPRTPLPGHPFRLRAAYGQLERGEIDAAGFRSVQDELTAYLDPLKGGKEGKGWEFGGDVYYSDVYGRILAAKGVDRVIDNQLFIWLDDERHASCEDVAIGDGMLVYAGDHDIRVSYQERR